MENKKYKLLIQSSHNITCACGKCPPEVTISGDMKEEFMKIMNWDEAKFKQLTVEIIPYHIYVCNKCKVQLDEDIMGSKCPECREWTYHKDCKKECVLLGADE